MQPLVDATSERLLVTHFTSNFSQCAPDLTVHVNRAVGNLSSGKTDLPG